MLILLFVRYVSDKYATQECNMILLNPKQHSRFYPDERSREIMLKTIEFFENKGKARLKADDHARVWNADFVGFPKSSVY